MRGVLRHNVLSKAVFPPTGLLDLIALPRGARRPPACRTRPHRVGVDRWTVGSSPSPASKTLLDDTPAGAVAGEDPVCAKTVVDASAPLRRRALRFVRLRRDAEPHPLGVQTARRRGPVMTPRDRRANGSCTVLTDSPGLNCNERLGRSGPFWQHESVRPLGPGRGRTGTDRHIHREQPREGRTRGDAAAEWAFSSATGQVG